MRLKFKSPNKASPTATSIVEVFAVEAQPFDRQLQFDANWFGQPILITVDGISESTSDKFIDRLYRTGQLDLSDCASSFARGNNIHIRYNFREAK